MGEVLAVQVSGLEKSYGSHKVLRNLSFDIRQGEIFGLLGPNGAGKTTAIRILLNIIKADEGAIQIEGEKFSAVQRDRIGYLPEERGLYLELRVMDQLLYFAALKNADPAKARRNAEMLLERVGLKEYAKSKVNELSKGMQQKVQFISTIIHDPDLIILDEPFSGLDPINSKLIKDMILELRELGKTVVLSTHQMEQVERMCDRIVMINRGDRVLYGSLEDVKGNYGRHSLVVGYAGEFPKKKMEGVKKAEVYGNSAELVLETGASPTAVLASLLKEKLEITKFELTEMSLNEIFISIVEGSK
ncbi:Trehalose/maltose import ATP-binding protein MalK [Candidatus Burarchaeum australiense]|nr:Trehalose/maltose import ATP-binding protein MalK [Candidatus Burarchaeum australiense]